ncbi:MAG: rRNA maturation RNase YbeY [Planctomycetes bacterium]|nr:rRNA maturation RNase YbeY [Planctomycetota bacterium]
MGQPAAYQIELTARTATADCGTDRLGPLLELALRRHDCRQARLSCALVDDPEIARLNEQYLGHQGPTDVLSFDLSEPGQPGLEGEIVVSVETARREAEKRNHDVAAEVALYCLHGALHLLGYDDAQPDQARRMHETEDELLVAAGIGPVYETGTR